MAHNFKNREEYLNWCDSIIKQLSEVIPIMDTSPYTFGKIADEIVSRMHVNEHDTLYGSVDETAEENYV